MALGKAGASLPFREQIDFYRRKLNLPTSGWTDVRAGEHDYAFVVAGANRDAILTGFREALQKVIDRGATLEEFRKDFDRIVAATGWAYKGGRGWRSRLIYDTNLNAAYQAGRYVQLQEAPYWQYEHQDWVENPREEHQAWDGLVLAREDPWWQTHYPPNDYFCHCRVHGLWPRDLQRLGKTGPDKAPEVRYVEKTIGARSALGPRTVRVPEGIGPGWDYAPGAARLRSAIPMERSGSFELSERTSGAGLPNLRPHESLPPARQFPRADLLPQGGAPEGYVRDFLARFGATIDKPAIVRDVIGERLVIGAALFQDTAGEWSVLKNGREVYLPLLARTIQEPDEIWVRLEWLPAQQRAVVRRRYVARFDDGSGVPTLVVFELGKDGWSGVTILHAKQAESDGARLGVRLYRRPQ